MALTIGKIYDGVKPSGNVTFNIDSRLRRIYVYANAGYKFSQEPTASYYDGSGIQTFDAYKNTNSDRDSYYFNLSLPPSYMDNFEVDGTLVKDAPTTTTSYTLNSYANGTVIQSNNGLGIGNTVTYTLTPSSGYEVKSASVYRFSGSTLATVDWSKGTKVKDLDIKNPAYTIVQDDIGNSICINVDFEKIPEKHFTGTVTNYLKDGTTYSIDNDIITLKAKDGFKIKSANLQYQPYPGAGNESIGDFTVSSDNLTATINIPDEVKNDKTINLTIEGETSTDLEHIKPDLKADNVTVTIKGNTVTVTANDGFLIDSATLDIGNSLFGDDTPLEMTVSSDKTTATVTVTDESLIDPNQEYNLTVKTSEKPKPKPKTLQEIKPTLKADNVTVAIKDNTVIVTANDGYLIKGGYVGVGEVGVFTDNSSSKYSFVINKEQTQGTINIPDDKVNENRNYSITVFTDKKPTQPTQPTTPPKYDITKIKVADDLKDKNIKYTLSDDNILTVTIDKPYIFNSVYLEMNGEVGSVTKKSDNFKLSDDKMTATLKLPDFLTSDPSSFAYIEGDIADTTPIKPVTPNSHLTQHVYQMDETGLEKFVTSSMTQFSGKVENYDYTTFINQLYTLPFNIDQKYSKSVGEVITGLFTLKTDARELNEILFNLDLGEIKVTPVNNNGFDANIQSIKLYLPFVSPIDINYNDCLNKTISIKYVISFLTGQTTVNIYSDDKLINSLNVSIQTNLQLFSIYNNKDFGQLNTTLNSGLNKAYIKVNYYKPVENLVSYETLEHNELKKYTGFVQTNNSIISCGTYQEQQTITQLLDKGVIINDIAGN